MSQTQVESDPFKNNFNGGISLVLDIETTHTEEPHTNPNGITLMNRFESPDSEIQEISFRYPYWYPNEQKGESWNDPTNYLTEEDYEKVAFAGKEITVEEIRVSLPNFKQLVISKTQNKEIPEQKEERQVTRITFTAPNGEYFTIRDMMKVIIEFEKVARPKSKWFGGIDCHHVFFEGFSKTKSGAYSIFWGS